MAGDVFAGNQRDISNKSGSQKTGSAPALAGWEVGLEQKDLLNRWTAAAATCPSDVILASLLASPATHDAAGVAAGAADCLLL